LLCKAIANFPGSARPAPTGPNSIFRRAVYFDPTKNHPEFIWLELRKEPVGTYLYLLAVLDDLLKCKKVEHGIEYITINERTKRDLGKAIYVTFRDNFYNDGSIRNEGIRRAIDPALRNVAQEWRGPVVFYGMEDVDYEPEVPSLDLDASDIRHIVDWLHAQRGGSDSEISIT
jgi:hypothetical protein